MKQPADSRETQWQMWMLAARRGDAAAYKRLLSDVTEYLRPLARRGALKVGLSHADAEDIVQETLLAIHMKQHTWKETELFGPWIRAIARYKLIDAIRRRSGRKNVDIEDFTNTLAAEPSEPQLPARDIIRMAETLPDKQRSVVLALFVDGQTTQEAAARYAMTEGAVRVTLHRALTALAKRFGDREGNANG